MSYPSFLQMNFRTYIQFDDEPGIYFFSVDVNRMLTMITAKNLLQLPYEMAEISMERIKDYYLFKSKRTKQIDSDARIFAKYQPLENIVCNKPNTLSHWLTDRYCFWMINGNKIIKGPISHMPWTLYHAELELIKINIAPSSVHNKYLHSNPLAHYGKSMHAYLHPFEQQGIYNH